MPTAPDLERRRAQNREAQRRFRQRNRKAAEQEEDQAILSSALCLGSDSLLDLYIDKNLQPGSEGASFLAEWTEKQDQHCVYHGPPRTGTDTGISFTELEHAFSHYISSRTDVPAWSDLSTSPGEVIGPECLFDDLTEPQSESQSLSPKDTSEESISAVSVPKREKGTGTGTGAETGGRTGTGSGSAHPAKAGETPSSGWLGPLHLAARKGHIGIIRVLLCQKMDSNEQDSDGMTPLMHAVREGHCDVARLLLDHGALLDRVDGRQRSALHWAVPGRREDVLGLLLERAGGEGSLVDAYDDAGCTALHMAIDIGFEPGVVLLIEHGANVNSWARKPPERT